MTYYLDTSALVKIYHRESGTGSMHQLYAGAERIQISELARLEFMSVTMRKLRDGQLDDKAHRSLWNKFEDDIRKRYEMLFFSSLVSEEAARILAVLGQKASIRTLDAIQFAFYNVCCEESTIFVCADQRLLTAVRDEGRQTLNPLAS